MRVVTESNEQVKQVIENEQKGQFVTEKLIGSGTFGQVYLAVWKSKDKLVALKNVYQDAKYKNRELEILNSIKHPAVVQLYHSFYQKRQDGTYLNLAMEYLPETLSKLIRQKNISKQYIDNDIAKSYAFWILNALDYLKQKGISHRDIKPSNILVGQNKQAKLCDFGSAKILIKGQKNLSYICSRYYRAPELIFGAIDYSTAIDIWSFGCVLAEVLTNQPPFQGSSNMNQIVKIFKILGTPSESDYEGMKVKKPEKEQVMEMVGIGIQNKILKINPKADKQLLQLIKKMLVYNPIERITPKQALSLPMFKQFQLLKSEKNME